jgi:2,3-bisphosphoglycerate-dependent phosphoglycerate mutase
MSTTVILETHATSEDNEAGVAAGWLPGRLSPTGRAQAAELGRRRRGDGIDAVFASDLRRAVETAEIAFGDAGVPILLDWRLRECDYGDLNGAPRAVVHGDRVRYLDAPYPGGESWQGAVERAGRFVDDLPLRWTGKRVLVVGHIATRWAFEQRLNGVALEELVAEEFVWRPGWVYRAG